MKKYKARKKKLEFNSEKEYTDYYKTLSTTYKTIHLNKWNILFSEVLRIDPKNVLANNMFEFCKKEQEILSIEKQNQDQKMDEQLNINTSFHFNKKKRR